MGRVYNMNDGEFSFHCARYGSWNGDAQIIFRVREDTNPEVRAQEKGIEFYDRIVPATPEQIILWLVDHAPHYHFEKEK